MTYQEKFFQYSENDPKFGVLLTLEFWNNLSSEANEALFLITEFMMSPPAVFARQSAFKYLRAILAYDLPENREPEIYQNHLPEIVALRSLTEYLAHFSPDSSEPPLVDLNQITTYALAEYAKLLMDISNRLFQLDADDREGLLYALTHNHPNANALLSPPTKSFQSNFELDLRYLPE